MTSPAALDRPVTIAVLTFRREGLLPGLVGALRRQLATIPGLPEGSGILVVDNDPQASARTVVLALDGVRYSHEPHPGIAAARQRALDDVPQNHLLVFIDDDELPADDWLRLLTGAWLEHGRPAGVAGRVVPRFEVEPDPWVVEGAFFVRTEVPTGTPVHAAGAGNLLLDLEQVTSLRLSFDPRLGLRGGEDTLFTTLLTRRGGRLIRCREAEAFDLIPAARATRRWVLRRAFSQGGAAAHVALVLADGPARRLLARLRLIAGGLARIPAGLMLSLMGWIRNSGYHRARGPWLVLRGLGLAMGAFGYRSQEYHRKKKR